MEIMPILIFRSEIPYIGQKMWSKVLLLLKYSFLFQKILKRFNGL